MALETQRGCLFKCKFCTFRTLQISSMLSSGAAVEAILAFGNSNPQGILMLTDATATFPRGRWREILEGLASSGGSRVPIFCYARANDLDSEIVGLMQAANVVRLFIGQESGQDRILKAMAKGIDSQSLPNAVKYLDGTGIEVIASFIHGYPGESPEDIAATRDYVARINDGTRNIVVPYFSLSPFLAQDLAAIDPDNARPDLQMFSPFEEVINTFVLCAITERAPNFFPILSGLDGSNVDKENFRLNKLIQLQIARYITADGLDGRLCARKLEEARSNLTMELRCRGQKKRSILWRTSRRLFAKVVEFVGRECGNRNRPTIRTIPLFLRIWALWNGVSLEPRHVGSANSGRRVSMREHFVNRTKTERLKAMVRSDFDA